MFSREIDILSNIASELFNHLDPKILDCLDPKWLWALDTAGMAMVIVAIQARLHYMTSSFYNSRRTAQISCAPTVVFINRLSVWGFLFCLSLLCLLLKGMIKSVEVELLRMATFFAIAAFIAISIHYFSFLIKVLYHRFNERETLDKWLAITETQ